MTLLLALLILPVAAPAQDTQHLSTDERITLVATPKAPLPDADLLRQAFIKASFQTPDGRALPYRFFRAAPAPSRRLPLIIFLHGSGQIGSDNTSQLDGLPLAASQPSIQSRFPAYILAPQFATRSASYHVSPTDGLRASLPDQALLPLFDLVSKLLATEAIDPTRVYLVGFSMGASTTYHALLLHPELFAAGIALSGVPPERIIAPTLAQVPLLICHGDADPENPYAPDHAFFEAIGPHANASFRTYTGLSHTPPPDIADPTSTWWREWLFAQHR